MLYNPPSGSVDPNAPYVGKNLAAGLQGSKVPRLAIEATQREIVNAIVKSGQSPTNDDLSQLWKAMQRATPAPGLWHYGTAGGSRLSLVVDTTEPAITEYATGLTCLVDLPAGFGIGTGATIKFGALPTVPLLRNDGSQIQEGDGPAGSPSLFVFKAGAFRLVGFGRQEVPRIVSSPLLYVRTDGNDGNDGSANDAAHAFRTPAAAMRYGASRFSFVGAELRVQLGNPGEYEAPGTVIGGNGTILLRGDPAAQDIYVLSGSGVSGGGTIIASGGRLNCSGFTLRNTDSIAHTFAVTNNANSVLDHVTLACTSANNQSFAQIFSTGGGNVTLADEVRFAGSMGSLLQVSGGVINLNGVPFRLLDTPNYAFVTAFIGDSGRIVAAPGSVFIGSAIGKRYLAALNGTMNAVGAGANFFPGTIAGTEQTGGRYAL